MTAPSVRPATADDVSAIAALEASALGVDAWSAALVADAVTGPASVLVALDGRDLAGHVVVARAGDDVELQRIAVAADHRRRGLAGALLDAALEASGSFERVLLEVRADNTPAIAFYRRCGFTDLGVRPGYYRDGVDALVMERRGGGAVPAPPAPGFPA